MRACVLIAALAIGAISAAGRFDSTFRPPTDRGAALRGPVYMLIGAGGNVTASVGPDGVVVATPARSR